MYRLNRLLGWQRALAGSLRLLQEKSNSPSGSTAAPHVHDHVVGALLVFSTSLRAKATASRDATHIFVRRMISSTRHMR